MSRGIACVLACTLPVAAGNALANTPTFDRPGIAFFTSIIPHESFAYELGLQNFLHASDAGSKSWLYSLDNNVRASLGEKISSCSSQRHYSTI